MAETKNYIGKVIKVTSDYGNGPTEITGIVYHQEPNPWGGDNPRLSMLLTNGSTFEPPAKNIQKITSTRIPEDMRKALTAGCKALQNQRAFRLEYREKQRLVDDAVGKAMQTVKEISPEMAPSEFMQKLEELFRSRYPSSGGYYQRYFTCSSLSDKEATMTHVQDVEKYATPSGYSFLGEEYDRTLYIIRSDPSLQRFCEKNAPAPIPELSRKLKSQVGASIGDKNWLSAHRTYAIPLKHGYTKQSLEQIRTELLGMAPTMAPAASGKGKTSLTEKIASAEKKTASGGTKTPGKEKAGPSGR